VIDLDNVIVHEKIARMGGSGAAIHRVTVDGWQCVMKELDLSYISNTMKASFESEILLLESLPPHKNLVRYLFHQLSKTKMRLFMTYYSGGDFATYIRKRREEYETIPSSQPPALHPQTSIPRIKKESSFTEFAAGMFSPKDILRFMLDIATGLEVLHNMKILHRDLKSDNIFVTLNEVGKIDSLAVGDFDTAKQLQDGPSANTVIGTPGYIAPEVYQQEYSYAADVWSFGAICFEVITFQRPCADELVKDIGSLIKKIHDQLKLSDDYKGVLSIMKVSLFFFILNFKFFIFHIEFLFIIKSNYFFFLFLISIFLFF
jgi:serine/threonine protein kinase